MKRFQKGSPLFGNERRLEEVKLAASSSSAAAAACHFFQEGEVGEDGGEESLQCKLLVRNARQSHHQKKTHQEDQKRKTRSKVS